MNEKQIKSDSILKLKLSEVAELRKNKKHEEAALILRDLLETFPNDPEVNYRMACVCDYMGKESEAAPYYERALANNLSEDRKGAFLGLGSTYRCLGEYEKSLKVFDQALSEFPSERFLQVFRSLTLFNLGRAEESVSQLLVQLLDTTSDDSIKSYERALRFYSDKLSQTWT